MGHRRRGLAVDLKCLKAGELSHAYSLLNLKLAFFNLTFDENSLDSLGSIDHLRV